MRGVRASAAAAAAGWAGGIRTHGMTESKSVALPLGDSPVWRTRSLIRKLNSVFRSVGWKMGLEPTVSRATIWRFNQLSYIHHMARQKGLEPLAYCLEGSCSIQLSYWRKIESWSG